MTSKPNLRAVKPGDPPPAPKPPLSLAEAVEQGNYLEILRAQRRDIATSLPEEKGPAKAALHRQLSIIAKEIETLEARDSQEESRRAGDSVSDEAFDAEAI